MLIPLIQARWWITRNYWSLSSVGTSRRQNEIVTLISKLCSISVLIGQHGQCKCITSVNYFNWIFQGIAPRLFASTRGHAQLQTIASRRNTSKVRFADASYSWIERAVQQSLGLQMLKSDQKTRERQPKLHHFWNGFVLFVPSFGLAAYWMDPNTPGQG